MSSSPSSAYQVLARLPAYSPFPDVAREQKKARVDRPMFDFIMRTLHSSSCSAYLRHDLRTADMHWDDYQYWLSFTHDDDAGTAADAAGQAATSAGALRAVSHSLAHL